MRILLTNDDGISAPGLAAIREQLLLIGEVFVIAPERPRSASGHSITLHKPLRLTDYVFPDGGKGWACSGTPTDCVTLGWDIVMKGNVDVVISGINAGPNLGWDLTYSGTVAAAMEGAILGAPAVAISVAGEGNSIPYECAAEFGLRVVSEVMSKGMEQYTLLNINVPAIPAAEVRGVAVTRQGKRQYVDRIDIRTDPWGKQYYWLKGSLKDDLHHPETDVHAVLSNYISVTPIHLDMTADHLIQDVTNWDFGFQIHSPE